MEDMGMTDKQFNGFLRMLEENLKEALKQIKEEHKTDKLERAIENIQKTIEN